MCCVLLPSNCVVFICRSRSNLVRREGSGFPPGAFTVWCIRMVYPNTCEQVPNNAHVCTLYAYICPARKYKRTIAFN